MKPFNITTSNTEFVLLSFEGPDAYSRAGGLGVRMDNLSHTLASAGFKTHFFFIGDPDLPGEEMRENGKLILHRWCQWISRFHPGGVYDGEEGKLADFTGSIPGYVAEKIAGPAAAEGKIVVVLGEEWHTAEAVCRLSDALYNKSIRDEAILFWNANNIFSFHRINWGRLSYAAVITTISRYMKYIMQKMGLHPLVIPNGIPRSLLHMVDTHLADGLRSVLGADIFLFKVARWDPDKNWKEAVEATARLKDRGFKTILLARGGQEPYGSEVIDHARSLGLTVKEARTGQGDYNTYISALAEALPADMINIRFHLPLDFLALCYYAADGVLANSGHEPFGIVGLEAMAAGGLVFTGSTGEDYSIPFINSFMIETSDPMEMVNYIVYLKNYPRQAENMRQTARMTARFFTWEAAALNLIGKLENQGRVQGVLNSGVIPQTAGAEPAENYFARQVWQMPE